MNETVLDWWRKPVKLTTDRNAPAVVLDYRVRAVLDLANLCDADDMVAAFCPGMNETVAGIGELLVAVNSLEAGDTDLLATFYDVDTIEARYADELADEKVAELRGEIIGFAQLCASVIDVRARKAEVAA